MKKVLFTMGLSLVITIVSLVGVKSAENEANTGISVCDTGGDGFIWVVPFSL